MVSTDQELPISHIASWLKYEDELLEFDRHNVSSAVSEGNIITTPEDLATWGHVLYATNDLLDPAFQANDRGTATYEIHVSNGLGCETHPADLGYGHNGARPAYMTVMRNKTLG